MTWRIIIDNIIINVGVEDEIFFRNGYRINWY